MLSFVVNVVVLFFTTTEDNFGAHIYPIISIICQILNEPK